MRGAFTRWSVSAAIAGFALLLATPGQRTRLIAAGPLSGQHATIAEAEGGCERCHSLGDSGALTWMARAVTGDVPRDDARRCLACHPAGEDALGPHGLPAGELAGRTEGARQRGEQVERSAFSVLAGLAGAGRGASQVPCATCHHEHRGQGVSLADVPDRTCQACHAVRFAEGFAGHPELRRFPYVRPGAAGRGTAAPRRRTRIAFDHATHVAHFEEKGEALTCQRCHVSDRSERDMLLRGFEESCGAGACHAGEVTEGEVVALVFPLLHDTVEQAAATGSWPPRTSRRKRPTALMNLLLWADQEARESVELAAVDDSLAFKRVRADEPRAAEATAHAWAVKRLLWDLVQQGGAALEHRVEALAAAAGLADPPGPELSRGLAWDVVGPPAAGWLPGLPAEMGAADAGSAPGPWMPTPTASDAGWGVDERNAMVRYAPTGHADPVVRAWLELTAALDGMPAVGPLAAAALAELGDPKRGPGQCLRCHTRDRDGATGATAIRWRGEVGASDEESFTTFSHAPHVRLMTDRECQGCHPMDPSPLRAEGDDATDPFEGLDPTVGRGNFGVPSKEACATCHVPDLAGADCTQCHRYHVGGFVRGAQAFEGVRLEGSGPAD